MSIATIRQNTFPFRKWLIYNSIGWLLGFIFILVIASTFDALGIHNLQFFLGAGIGAGVGLAQWMVLRKLNDIGGRWILFTVVGLGIPFLIADILGIIGIESLIEDLQVGIIAGGLLAAYLQSKILKSYGVTTSQWITASLLAWILIGLLVYGMRFTDLIWHNRWFGFFTNLAILLSGGPIIGWITGRLLTSNLKLKGLMD
ncbi:MAG: hypothetical protein R3275_11715 [Saprospiraceae bacterium]|nr:hypothetical protein [Saprospiraceae bacterium]